MFRNKKNAFTLIELMIVIAIIGLLASIVSFQYSKIRDKVRRKACQINMKRIYEAGQEYLMDHTSKPQTVHQITVTVLKNAGYLKTIPRCPIHSNRYAISGEDKGKIKVSCFNPSNPKAGHGNYFLNDK